MGLKLNILTISAVLIYAVLLSFTVVEAQEEIQCRGKDLNMTEQQLGYITDCLKEAGINSIWKIPPTKISCFGVCILEKKKLLTADGKLDHDRIYDYIYHVMQPEEVKKPLVDGTEKCIKDFGEVVRIANDPACSAYLNVGQCVHDLFFEMCYVD